MSYEKFKKIKSEIPYMQKDGEKYTLIFYDENTNTCKFKHKPLKQKVNKKIAMLPTYEDVCKKYNVEIEEHPLTPAQYFMWKIHEENNPHILFTVSNPIFVSYMRQHKEEYPDVINKLIEIIKTHPDEAVRKAASKTHNSITSKTIDSIPCDIRERVEGDLKNSNEYIQLLQDGIIYDDSIPKETLSEKSGLSIGEIEMLNKLILALLARRSGCTVRAIAGGYVVIKARKSELPYVTDITKKWKKEEYIPCVVAYYADLDKLYKHFGFKDCDCSVPPRTIGHLSKKEKRYLIDAHKLAKKENVYVKNMYGAFVRFKLFKGDEQIFGGENGAYIKEVFKYLKFKYPNSHKTKKACKETK
ncbi:MAG: hypothetical protein J6D26_00975 [Clostridia bacterium]|nr:hypothetical protein [Clostridia bacterium]